MATPERTGSGISKLFPLARSQKPSGSFAHAPCKWIAVKRSPPSKATLADVWDDYEQMFRSLVAAGEKAPRTAALYGQQRRSHLEPSLGRVQVQKVTPQQISRLLSDLRAAGLSSWTIKAVWTRLASLFAHAMTRGLISESPLKRI
jgi:hypothetical protein